MELTKKNTVLWINLVVAFILELCLVFIYGYWVFTFFTELAFKIIAGTGFPLILIILWWKYFAPRSTRRLSNPWLSLGKVLLFSLATLALLSIGKQTPAIWFTALAYINLVVLFIYNR